MTQYAPSLPRPLRLGGLLLAGMLVALGCQSDPDSPTATSASPEAGTRLDGPAPAESGQPHLHAGEDGTVWMSWVEPVGEDRHALRYATLDDTSWAPPRTAARGGDWFVNWADVPSLRPLPSGRLAAQYLRSTGPDPLAYAVQITQTDGAGTWQSAVRPHDDGTATEHGFVSLLPWPDDRLLAVWLDGRTMAGRDGHGGEMTLRGGVLDATGTVEQRALLDDRTCECCPTTAVRTKGEALVAYRDRSADEVRNIRLVRFDGQSWSDPAVLHDDGWRIEGCPVNGPALAAAGNRVAAAWYTAPGGVPRVNVAFSADGGRQFGDPIVVAKGTPTGRVDVAWLGEGRVAVSWLGTSADGAPALRVRAVATDGASRPAVPMATLASASRGVGMPRLVRSGPHLYAAWTHPEEGVQVGRLRTNALR
ncbi:hypothetical protein [Salinibacter ruber]|uniref:hypothetical protein n=1 Tax=Salinibacter ruber TaxID=146919 RepID=UPI002169E043|nr:hypothetical protein [Salinibacter ruber]MCS3758142.1 hypothetical protein [Salinibacter ruber]MCS3954795.1 hypothetical protein [Salinibacter ruber]